MFGEKITGKKIMKKVLVIGLACLMVMSVAFAEASVETSIDARGKTTVYTTHSLEGSSLQTTMDSRGKLKFTEICVPVEVYGVQGIECTQTVSARGRGTYVVDVGTYALQPDFEFKIKKTMYNDGNTPLENDQVVLEYRGHMDGEGTYVIYEDFLP